MLAQACTHKHDSTSPLPTSNGKLETTMSVPRHASGKNDISRAMSFSCWQIFCYMSFSCSCKLSMGTCSSLDELHIAFGKKRQTNKKNIYSIAIFAFNTFSPRTRTNTLSHLHTFIPSHLHTFTPPTLTPSYLHTLIPSRLPTFIPSHLHTFTPSNFHTFIPSYLHTFTPSHLPLSHLHSFTPLHLHTFIPSYPYALTPSHLHTFRPSHLHTFIPSYPHTLTASHLRTFTPSYLHTFIPLYFIPSHLPTSIPSNNYLPSSLPT